MITNKKEKNFTEKLMLILLELANTFKDSISSIN